MLRGDNGILNRGAEAKFANGISQFDEQTKLASMAVRTSIEANKVSKAGYIATYNGTGENAKNYFTGLANDVAKELGVTAIAGGSGTIARGGYTVAYYLDKEGSTTQNGNGYIVIWYTDNSLRSSINMDNLNQYGLNIISNLSTNETENKKLIKNQAVLVTVIHVENYKSELAVKGITSLTDSDTDIEQLKFGDTTLNGQLGFSSSPTTNNAIQIVATEMSESEISQKGITRQQNGSVIIKVTQAMTKEQLQIFEQTELQSMFVIACQSLGEPFTNWNDISNGDTTMTIEDAFENFDMDEMGYSDVYDLIIKTGAYSDKVEALKYIYNNTEKTGKEVYFELTDEGNYEIIAKDENNNIVGTTTYNYELPPLTITVHLNNGTDSFQITWDKTPHSNQEIMEQIVSKLNEQVGYDVDWVYFADGTLKTSKTIFNYSSTNGYDWTYFDSCPIEMWSLGY